MKETFVKILSWSWVTIHSALYLIGAGVMLRFFDVFGMCLWLVSGWILLVPTLVLPSVLWRKFVHREETEATVHSIKKDLPMMQDV